MDGADSSPGSIRALHAALRAAARLLRAVPLAERAAALERACARLLDAEDALGRALRAELLVRSGLSASGIELGLSTTLGLFRRGALCALHRARGEGDEGDHDHDYDHDRDHDGVDGVKVCVAVLAGNVFSAAARPLLLPLLCGRAVLAKASSADDVLPRYLARALDAVDPRLGAACAVLRFGRGEPAREAALLSGADVVSIYGDDDTLASLRGRACAGARLLAHGHGFGAIVVGADALGDEASARELATRVALDVAAYDQRGCLSPQALLVLRGGALGVRAFARLLGEALQACEQELPRGVLPPEASAAQLQWLGVAAALGELERGERWAVSYEAQAALRPSPGYRNLSVYELADLDAVAARLRALGAHLKALGLAGSAPRALAPLAPYACEVGAMQIPPLETPLDNLHPLDGYL